MWETYQGMDRRRTYESLKHNPKNVRFDDLCRAAETFGFFLRGGKRQPQGLCAAGRHGATELPKRGWEGKALSGSPTA